MWSIISPTDGKSFCCFTSSFVNRINSPSSQGMILHHEYSHEKWNICRFSSKCGGGVISVTTASSLMFLTDNPASSSNSLSAATRGSSSLSTFPPIGWTKPGANFFCSDLFIKRNLSSFLTIMFAHMTMLCRWGFVLTVMLHRCCNKLCHFRKSRNTHSLSTHTLHKYCHLSSKAKSLT